MYVYQVSLNIYLTDIQIIV